MPVHSLSSPFFVALNVTPLSGCTTVYLERKTFCESGLYPSTGILGGKVSESCGGGGIRIAAVFFLPCL